ncbi:MAG: UvrD-helicase domain-containing protein [Thermomicrobiales bacterium]
MAPLLYDVVHKETFTNQLLALPSNAIPQVIQKIELLRTAPAPDAKSKKKLAGLKNPIFRLRSGDYRIIYTFSESERWVALLGVDARKDVYRNGVLVDMRVSANTPGDRTDQLLDEYTQKQGGGAEAETHEATASAGDVTQAQDTGEDIVVQPARSQKPETSTNDDLPQAITVDLLRRLRIPERDYPELVACRTVDDLTRANVTEDVRGKVFDAVAKPDFDHVFEKPNLVAQELSDFQRYYDGELVAFLLRLDDEQKRFVNWAVHGSGPALLKGGPGSGKTVVALYRVRALVEALRASGNPRPRILFTAYTNTLVTAARQMLRGLLDEADANRVEIFTADKLARDIAVRAGALPADIIDDGQAMAIIKKAMDRLAQGSSQDQALVRSIQSLNLPYVLDEIDSVIVAREHDFQETYLAQSRAGRGKRLTATQRQAIWRVYEECERSAQQTNRLTWAQFRRRVVNLVRNGQGPAQYDGVLIDEAQDLQPTTLRMLVGLCKSKDRLFLTADPNQSIFGSGFRWADVHEDLQFRGRTGVLHTNYRSTHQIMAGAEAYLRGAELDEPEDAPRCPRNGSRPVVRFFADYDEQMETLLEYIQSATRRVHCGLGGCAVLTPTWDTGEKIAQWLTAQGKPARFMPKSNIRLDSPEIKVVPLKSAKGLEFPVVVLAGLSPRFPGPYPVNATDDQIQEIQLREQRTLYVGMTRAMESLLVLAPRNAMTLTAAAFDSTFWEIEQGTSGDVPGPHLSSTLTHVRSSQAWQAGAQR